MNMQVNPNGYPQTHDPNWGKQVAPVMTVKDWLIVSLIMIIPLVNIIMLFVWAFGDGTNPNKRNYCRAALIMFAILLGLYLIIFIVLASLIAGLGTFEY